MEQFLGIHIMAGIVNVPNYRMYWANSTRCDPIADVMSRNWFDTMRNYFHMNDNNTMKARDDPEYDRLFKVRPFVDSVGHWPEHTEKKQRCKLCIKAYSRVKCVKCEKAFCLTKCKNSFMAYHIK